MASWCTLALAVTAVTAVTAETAETTDPAITIDPRRNHRQRRRRASSGLPSERGSST
jgi:hypothetical protein